MGRPYTDLGGLWLEFELFWVGGEVFAACWGDDSKVFDTDGAAPEVVEAGFYGDDMARLEDTRGFADAWRFVDFQTQSVAGAVEEALHSAVDFSGLKALCFEEVHNGLVNFFAICACADSFQGQDLAIEYGVVQASHFFGRFSADHGAGDVCKIAVVV